MSAVRMAAVVGVATWFGLAGATAWADAGANRSAEGVQTAFLGQLFGWPRASLGGGVSVGYPSVPAYSAPVSCGPTSCPVPGSSVYGTPTNSGYGGWAPVTAPRYSPTTPNYSPSVPVYQSPAYRSTLPGSQPVTLPAVGSGSPTNPVYYDLQPVRYQSQPDAPRNRVPSSVPGGSYGSGGSGGSVNSPFYP